MNLSPIETQALVATGSAAITGMVELAGRSTEANSSGHYRKALTYIRLLSPHIPALCTVTFGALFNDPLLLNTGLAAEVGIVTAQGISKVVSVISNNQS
jgi:hypothetical protein